VDNDLVTHSFSSNDNIFDDRVGGGREEYDEGDKHNLEPVPSVSIVHAAYRTVK